MRRETVNRIAGLVPVLLSLAALGVVTLALVTGAERGQIDEDAFAHIFQLLIVAQVPCLGIFLATADPARAARIAGTIVLQAAAIAVACAPVAFFKL